MQSGINRDGFTPEDLLKDELVEEGALPFPDAPPPAAGDNVFDDEINQINHLRRQVSLLTSELADITEKQLSGVQAKAKAVDADAHLQLGDYPWLKLAAVFAVVFVATRAMR